MDRGGWGATVHGRGGGGGWSQELAKVRHDLATQQPQCKDIVLFVTLSVPSPVPAQSRNSINVREMYENTGFPQKCSWFSGEGRCERAVHQGTHLRVWTLESDHLVSKQSRLLTSLVT